MNTTQHNKSQQQPLFMRTTFSRENWLTKAWLNLFFALSSRPRMLLETPIRRNPGERYFNFSSCIFLALMLAAYPIFDIIKWHSFRNDEGEFSLIKFLLRYLTWYAYLAVFLYSTFERQNEVRRLPGVFDFMRYSLSNGYIHPFFRNLKINGKRYDRRVIEIWLEPGVFFAGGLLLWLLGQAIGPVLLVCSIIYSLSYKAAYRQGDDAIMDRIDEIIVSQEIGNIIIEGREAEETRGVTYIGHRPEDPQVRHQMVEMLAGRLDTFTVVSGSANRIERNGAKAVLREDV